MGKFKFNFTTIGCFLIGWNHFILARCGEASHRQFRKYVSAILIMMIVWGTIGYCFADFYVNIDSLAGKVAIALAFMFIIVCIERIIILTVGKAPFMAGIRIVLAIMMAILGSSIFDQIIFRNDIKEELTMMREHKVQELVESRVQIIDNDVARIEIAMDSLSKSIEKLSEEVSKRPVIKTVDFNRSTTNTGQLDANGNPITSTTINRNESSFANPKAIQLNTSMQLYSKYTTQLDSLTKAKMSIQDVVVKQVHDKPTGFLEELLATVNVVKKSPWTIAFYFILFSVLMLIELFVVSMKVGDTKCDYDLLVEHQLNVKKDVLLSTEKELLKKDGDSLL